MDRLSAGYLAICSGVNEGLQGLGKQENMSHVPRKATPITIGASVTIHYGHCITAEVGFARNCVTRRL